MSLIAWIYGKCVALRNYLYDRGILDTFDLGARTISIGNITTGGTGKTPLVAYVADALAGRGEKVCILTRGYGRDDENRRVLVSDGEKVLADFREAGDEPVELAQKLLGKAIVIADADRVGAAEWAKRKFGVTVFVLDDGFQHRRVGRDVDIICIDATDPFGGGKVLPAGRLRERLSNLSRANAVVITRSDLISDADISNLKFQISNFAGEVKIFTAKNDVGVIVSAEEFNAKPQRKQRKKKADLAKCFAFCGIGNPESFFEMLRRNGINVAGTRTFRDHHFYTQPDSQEIEDRARDAGATHLLTTAKDAVKLSNMKFGIECLVVQTDLAINDAAGFADLL